MTVRPRKNKFMYDIWLPNGDRERKLLPLGTTYEAAEEIELRRRVQLGLTSPVFENCPTFAEFSKSALERWKTKATFRSFYQAYTRLLVCAFGHLKLSEITEDLIIRHQNKRLETCASTSVRHELVILKSVLKLALGRGLINRHPMTDFVLPKFTPPSKLVYSEDEKTRILEVLPKPFRFFFFALLKTGRRPKELQTATVGDYHSLSGALTFVDVKSKLPATRPLLPDVNHLLGYLSRGKKPSDPLLPSPKGKPWFLNNLGDRYLHPAQDKIGMARLPLYRCRATFASDLLNAGVSVKVVSFLLNHTNTATTEKFYAHLLHETAAGELKVYADRDGADQTALKIIGSCKEDQEGKEKQVS